MQFSMQNHSRKDRGYIVLATDPHIPQTVHSVRNKVKQSKSYLETLIEWVLSLKEIKNLELLSGIISFIGFIFALVFGITRMRKEGGLAQLVRYRVQNVNQNDTNTSTYYEYLQGEYDNVTDTCDANNIQPFNFTIEQKQILLFPTSYEAHPYWSPWIWLIWIQFFASFYQLSRYLCERKIEPTQNEDGQKSFKLLGKTFLRTKTPTVCGILYKPDGPEVLRWLEYASTAPLQIWIILYQSMVRDYMILGYATVAQTGLMWIGYNTELILQKSYKCCDKLTVNSENEKLNKKQSSLNWQLTWLQLSGWLIHSFTWYYIIKYAIDNLNCVDIEEDQKTIIRLIIGIECGFFSLFGLTQSRQCYWSKYEYTADRAEAKARRGKIWRYYTWWYCLWSISAKTALEILLIVGQALSPS